jgi:hypothetical protein
MCCSMPSSADCNLDKHFAEEATLHLGAAIYQLGLKLNTDGAEQTEGHRLHAREEVSAIAV